MLAVAFGPPNMAAACAGLERIRHQADCVELRLDLFEEPFDLAVLLRERGDLPAVATLRPPDQGGRSRLPPDQRLEVLLSAAKLGAEYVDLEYNVASKAALEALRAAGAKVIVSRHDFAAMPEHLADGWWPTLAELGADVVKVVGTATRLCDSLQVFRALQRADRPTIAIAMGEKGLMTRVLALRSDRCLLTYAALDGDGGTAPGQLSVSEMRQTYRVQRLTPTTRVFGLLGPHVEAERLREYNTWFASEGFDGVAVPFVASDSAAETVTAFRELPVSGWHIHGEALQREVVGALDSVPGSRDTVNAIVRRHDGSLIAHHVESPREQYELWSESS
jgi:3-dehydroquinate dehydratase/shikimate dehydrogenase